MNPSNFPLLDLFNGLRDHGLVLGIEEYTLILRALQAGFGLEDRQELTQLCCTLWAKSQEEAQLVQRLLEQILADTVSQSDQSDYVESPPHLEQPSINTSHEQIPTSQPSQYLPAPRTRVPPAALTIEANDEPVQVVQAIRRNASSYWPASRPRFSSITGYFPVTKRQMKQSWRYLRRPVRTGPPVELDVNATVEKIGREGLLLNPVLVPRRSNRAGLVLLIDQDGSMVPFHALSRQLVETARRGGQLGQTGIYYFHDFPDTFLYLDSARLTAQPIRDILAAISQRDAILIISDAGAARGNFDSERVERTRDFLKQLKQYVRRCVWLNPMPNHRWRDTTADQIARLIPMFELNRVGLDMAISTLRGRYTY